MLPGEKQRERVLSSEEERSYLDAATEFGHRQQQAYHQALEGIRAVNRGNSHTSLMPIYCETWRSSCLIVLCGLKNATVSSGKTSGKTLLKFSSGNAKPRDEEFRPRSESWRSWNCDAACLFLTGSSLPTPGVVIWNPQR
jgi:hypothetical protein